MTLHELRAAMDRLSVRMPKRHGRRLRPRHRARHPPLLSWSRVFDLSPWERMTTREYIRRAIA